MELTLDQALQKGVEAHKAGKAQEADRYYTAILKANPKHPDANHNMGVLAVGVGKVETALPFFKTAIGANPDVAQYWLSYINALIQLERMADAKAVLDQAKSKGAKGDGFDQLEKRLTSSPSTNSNTQEPPQEQLQSLINLYNQNNLQQVFNDAQTLTKRYSKSLIIWNLLGASAAQLGKLDEAVSAFQNAILIKPDHADAYNNMGNALKEQGKLEEAIDRIRRPSQSIQTMLMLTTTWAISADNKVGQMRPYRHSIKQSPSNLTLLKLMLIMGTALKQQGKVNGSNRGIQ